MKAICSAAVLAIAVPAALAQDVPVPPLAQGYLQRAERVAPRVYVLRQSETVFAGVIGNVTVIEQSDGLVLIDSGASHGVGKRVVAMIREISPKRVKAVVITHWHNDHPLGVSAILEAWAGAEVIAHAATAADMAAGRLGELPTKSSPEADAKRAATMRSDYAALAAAELPAVKTEAERAGWARLMAALDVRLAEIPGTYLVQPTRTFTEKLVLPDNEAPVELMFLGRANTSGDTSAWLPVQRVLVAGDAVVEPIPYMFNIYPTEMLAVWDAMRAMPYRVLVPGHGAPQHDTAYLHRIAGLARDVQRQVTPLARRGVPMDGVAGRTDFSAQRAAFAGNDPWLRYWFDRYTLNPLISSVWREARGEAPGPPPAGR